MDAKARATRIKLIAFDIDGVMTDGGLHYSDDGHEFKTFNVQDGLGIVLLKRVGIEVAIITGRNSGVVSHRAAVLDHHTHVLELTGGGRWALHQAEGFAFDEGPSSRSTAADTAAVVPLGRVSESRLPSMTVELPPWRCGAPGGRTHPAAGFMMGERSSVVCSTLASRASRCTSSAATPSRSAIQI